MTVKKYALILAALALGEVIAVYFFGGSLVSYADNYLKCRL